MVNSDRPIGPEIAVADLGGSRDALPLSYQLCFIFMDFSTQCLCQIIG